MKPLNNPLNDDSTPEQIMAHKAACERSVCRMDDSALDMISSESDDDVLVSAAIEEASLRQSCKEDPRAAQALGR